MRQNYKKREKTKIVGNYYSFLNLKGQADESEYGDTEDMNNIINKFYLILHHEFHTIQRGELSFFKCLWKISKKLAKTITTNTLT